MADPYQHFYDEADKLNQPPDPQPYPTPATDLAISRAAKLKAAEDQYYNTKNSQPGFVGYQDPGAMDEGTFQGLIDALKPQPIGAGLPRPGQLEPEMKQKMADRETEISDEEDYMANKEFDAHERYLDQQRKNSYATTTMNIGGEEWEVPLDLLGLDEDDMRGLGTDVSRWPPELRDELENRARDLLEQGKDPFGNDMNAPLDEQGNVVPPYQEPTPIQGE